MARGDIFSIDFPEPAGSRGHEQLGSRPAIAVQTDTADSNLPTTIVIPFTSQIDSVRFPHVIRIEPSAENGLLTISYLLVFQLRAIDKRRIGRKKGHLEPHYIEELEKEMRRILEI